MLHTEFSEISLDIAGRVEKFQKKYNWAGRSKAVEEGK